MQLGRLHSDQVGGRSYRQHQASSFSPHTNTGPDSIRYTTKSEPTKRPTSSLRSGIFIVYNCGMSKRELEEMLLRLLPYVNGRKQATALFTVALLLAMTRTEFDAFDAPHLHTEAVTTQPTTISMIAASGTAGPTGVTIRQIS